MQEEQTKSVHFLASGRIFRKNLNLVKKRDVGSEEL